MGSGEADVVINSGFPYYEIHDLRTRNMLSDFANKQEAVDCLLEDFELEDLRYLAVIEFKNMRPIQTWTGEDVLKFVGV